MTNSTDETIEQLQDSGVVAVLRGVNPDEVIAVVEALRDGGITAIEITADSENPEKMIQSVQDSFGDELVVGAGTVLDEETAGSVIDAGAEFVVSPVLEPEVIDASRHRDIPVAPGVFTPTEAYEALEHGADFIKVFPAATLGPSFLSALQGPLGDIPIMPTGGIDSSNVADYVDAGAFVVGVGGALLDNLPDGTTDLDHATGAAEQLREEVSAAREKR